MFKIEIDEWLHLAETLRQDLHRIPEQGLNEFKTKAYIETFLNELGVTVLPKCYETAVVACIGTEGPTVAFRADMDGLMVTEETNLPFSSEDPQMMHACGHDGHMTILLLFAKYLKQREATLKKRVLLIFQPAEEGPGGAEGIVSTGLLRDHQVSAIYGLHLFPFLPSHVVGLKAGPFMAQTSEFTVTVIGESAHGAQPQKGKDAVIAAASFVSAVQTIVSRRLSPMEPAVVTVGTFNAGERLNIIAKKAILEGTMRSFSQDVHNTVQREIQHIADGIAQMHQVTVNLEFRDMYPAVDNDLNLAERASSLLSKHLEVRAIEAQMLAEDFSYYQRAVPGLFLFLGTQNTKKGYVHPLHHACFNFDEDVLVTGLKMFAILLFGEDYA